MLPSGDRRSPPSRNCCVEFCSNRSILYSADFFCIVLQKISFYLFCSAELYLHNSAQFSVQIDMHKVFLQKIISNFNEKSGHISAGKLFKLLLRQATGGCSHLMIPL